MTAAQPIQTQAPPERLRMTYEEFLTWSGEDTHAEWVDGEVIEFMPPKLPHQTVASFLTNLLSLFVELYKLGRIVPAPFEVRLSDRSSREPDIFFVSTSRLGHLTEERMNGAPDLVVEVVSRDSVQRDHEDKYDEYEAVGVREYWIIDNRPRRLRAEFYALDEAGAFQPLPVVDGVVRSQGLPGFWLRVDWLWEDNPSLLRALAEIVGRDRLTALL
jgi:Uma2 family endonuclease